MNIYLEAFNIVCDRKDAVKNAAGGSEMVKGGAVTYLNGWRVKEEAKADARLARGPAEKANLGAIMIGSPPRVMGRHGDAFRVFFNRSSRVLVGPPLQKRQCQGRNRTEKSTSEKRTVLMTKMTAREVTRAEEGAQDARHQKPKCKTLRAGNVWRGMKRTHTASQGG